MDDLLIVRMPDRSNERFSRKSRARNTPVGMHLGLVLGIGLGLVFAAKSGSDPRVGLALGVAFGIAFGGLSGRFIKPNRRDKQPRHAYSYEGMPFETKEELEEPGPANEQ